MVMYDLDALIDAAVTQAEIENGVSAAVAMSRSSNGRAAMLAAATGETVDPQANAAEWTPEDDAYLQRHLGRLPLAQIASNLGRTESAIKIRWTRMGMEAPSKRDGEMVATEVGRRLGMCGKKIIRLIDTGILPGRTLPGIKGIRVVEERHLLRWLVQPRNFIYITSTRRIKDRRYRGLVQRAMARWDDEWLSTGQVARMHKVTTGAVTKAIYEGRLPAVRWQNWQVLRSDALELRFSTRSGLRMVWSEQADAFMVLASAIGLPWFLINQMMGTGTTYDLSWYRVTWLRDNGRIPALSKRHGLGIDGSGWADWRLHSQRFPGVTRAVRRFLAGDELGQADHAAVRGIMRVWLERWGDDDELGQQLKWASIASVDTLHGYRDALLAAGVPDPFEGVR